MNKVEKFKNLSQSKDDLALFLTDLNLKVSSSAEGRFNEAFVVTQILSEMGKDARVNLKILSERLREGTKCSLEDLESLISEKIADSDSEATTETSSKEYSSAQPTQASVNESALILSRANRKSLKSQAALLSAQPTRFGDADQKKSIIGKRQKTADSDDPVPFIEKIGSNIWDKWSETQRAKYRRILKTFKSEVRQMLEEPSFEEESNFFKVENHTGSRAFDNLFACLAQAPIEEVPPREKVPRISEGHDTSIAQEKLVTSLPSLNFLVDGGSSNHMLSDLSKFTSLQPCSIPIATAKKGEVLWAKGVGDVRVTTRNARGDPETLTLRNALYVPDVDRNIISCSALLKDNYQVILPSPSTENQFPAGIHNCRLTPFSASAAIPVHQIGSLYYVKTYEALKPYADNDRKATRSFAAKAQRRTQARRFKG